MALGRAFWVQAVKGPSFDAMATQQHRQTVTIPAGRGTIYDRNGVELAIGEQATTVYADPREVTDPRAVAVAAQELLGADPNRVYTALQDKKSHFVYLARQADPLKAAELKERKLGGVGFYGEERRTYPQRNVASQILGYAGVDNKGLAGIELTLEESLVGHPGSQTVVKAPDGTTLDVVATTPEQQGRSVVLSIDHTLQAQAERVMRDTMKEWGAKAAAAVVLDPRTGEVLAMANAPGYDANKYPQAGPGRQRNRAVTDTYEPGSTFKLVTVTAALGENAVEQGTKFNLPYEIRVADRVIHDAEERGTQWFTTREILAHSSNVGAITLAQKLGKERLSEWIERFGFGQPTGIDFPGESQGILLPTDMWSGSTIGNVPIGQGIAVTPLQMASAYATIANGGERIVPRLVQSVGGKQTKIQRTRVISEPLAKQINGMLTNVVSGGTGGNAAIPGYLVAGKTGTAEKPDPRGGYAEGKYVASFVGYVPASKPRFVVLVMVDEPRGAIFGGVVAAPAFREIASFALQYYEIAPDAPVRKPETDGALRTAAAAPTSRD